MTKTEPASLALSSVHEAAWRHYLRAHALLIRVLDADLRAQHGMTLVTYDALVQLSEAQNQQLHMKDLADALVYSASGLTRLVDALERDGYAHRQIDPANRRATLVTLTDDGLAALKAAWPTHAAGVQRHFASHTTTTQARTMATVFHAIRNDLDDHQA
ncbi:MarR family winged helix-turn-helix transcriptional regulator [Saccharopolyspora shandongensis]|uniref:MarR family winged helix-turn-helix transcriptional regulator n=1 Tax=Saccharopolyspora shandongensis TaxID=418495 RepID=UPI0033DD871F